MLTPAKTPQAIVDLLHANIVDVLKDHDLRAKMSEQGADVIGNSPARVPRLHRGGDRAAVEGDQEREDSTGLDDTDVGVEPWQRKN